MVVTNNMDFRYQVLLPSGSEPLTLSIGLPEIMDDGSVGVACIVTGPFPSSVVIRGATELQAHQLALKVLTSELRSISNRYPLREVFSGNDVATELIFWS
jgi:hypothetical protein